MGPAALGRKQNQLLPYLEKYIACHQYSKMTAHFIGRLGQRMMKMKMTWLYGKKVMQKTKC
jgi:ribosome-interacting GTPase 1